MADDYSKTFGHLKGRFVTLGIASRKGPSTEAIEEVRRALVREADENLVEDHFHPEIAGPLQQSVYFLDCVRERKEKT